MCNAAKISVVWWLMCFGGAASAATSGVEESGATEAAQLDAYLLRTSFIFGLAAAAGEGGDADTECGQQLRQWRAGVGERRPWALKMLDASGTRSSGFMLGNNYWMGSRESCTAAQRAVAPTLTQYAHPGVLTETAPFAVDFRVAYLWHNSSWQIAYPFFFFTPLLHVGLCVPSACALPDIEHRLGKYVASELFVATDIFEMRPTVAYVKAPKCSWQSPRSLGLSLVAAFLAFTVAMIAAAWLLDPKAESGTGNQQSTAPKAGNGINLRTSSDAVGPLRDWVHCFNIESNWNQLFTLREYPANEIPVINGIRTLSAVGVVMIHLLVFIYTAVPNTAQVFRYFDALKLLSLCVDAFFTISGFLRAYNFLCGKQLEVVQRNSFWANAKLFCFEIFHRYLRLMPLNGILIGIMSLGATVGHNMSTVHIHSRIDQMCANSWWRNFLFIHNFQDFNDVCAVWTWTLACEMHFYILATILLFVYAKHPRLAKFAVVMLLAANTLWTFSVSSSVNFQLTLDSFIINITEIYTNSLIRILPYIVGAVVAGCLVANRASSASAMSGGWQNCWGAAVFVVISSTLIGYHKQTDSVFLATLLYLGARLGMALIVCWLIVGSASGCGVWGLRLLEAKVFQHFGRVCYAMSLLNPLVLASIVPMASGLLHVDPFILGVLFVGFLFIIYAASVLCSLIFEMPYCHWSRLILGRGKASLKKDS